MTHLNPSELLLELNAVLSAPPGQEIRIVAAPPGSGKSDATRRAVTALLSAGRVKRVLWATRDTTNDNSLGAEAEAEFTRLLGPAGQTAVRVAGSEVARRKEIDQKEQLDWGRSSVKIISHAHLPILFGRDPRLGRLAAADLLVIDEDPLDSLLCSSHADKKPGNLNLASLRQVASPDPITAALLSLLEAASAQNLMPSAQLPTVRREPGNDLLDDDSFYLAFNRILTEILAPSGAAPDWAAFRTTLDGLLKEKNPHLPTQLIVQSFQQDAEKFSASGQASRRFGLRWTRGGLPETHALRYDLCRPVKFNLPVLILDGYADSQLYQAMFSACTISLRALGVPKPLTIEYKKELRLDVKSDWEGNEQLQVWYAPLKVDEAD